jgi:hypothetical protein
MWWWWSSQLLKRCEHAVRAMGVAARAKSCGVDGSWPLCRLGVVRCCVPCLRQWLLGCIVYSLSVSVKMNTLLFAPPLLVLLLRNTGLAATIGHLTACAAVQVREPAPNCPPCPPSCHRGTQLAQWCAVLFVCLEHAIYVVRCAISPPSPPHLRSRWAYRFC